MGPFQEMKLTLVSSLGLAKDALHIYVGVAVFLIAIIVLRRPARDWRPLMAVFVVALAGEIWDFIDVWKLAAAVYWGEHWHDMWNTMLIPTLLFLLARYTRILKR